MDFETCVTEIVVLLSGIIVHLGRGEPVEPVIFFVMNKSCEHIVTGSPDDGSRLRVSW
jgi:hypothetical protein